MLANHFKMALRATLKHKGYSAMNIFGLALGIACFTIIILYIRDELSYDTFHEDADRIYRVAVDRALQDGSLNKTTYTENALLSAMLREIPEIESGTRICRNSVWGKALLANSDYKYYDHKELYVDSTFFEIFSYHFVEGDKRSALQDPSSVVLTESLAQKFFGNGEAIGQTLDFTHYNFNAKTLKVSAVVADSPSQSHFDFDFLVPIHGTLSTVKWWKEGTWATDNTINSYFKLNPGTPLDKVQGKIQELANAHRENNKDTYVIQPLAGPNGIHLSSHRSGELGPNSTVLYIKILFIIAIFTILIAGINYVNLATARSAERAKEIGVRKVVGSFRRDLIFQLLFESILMAFFAGVLAVGLAQVSLPFFNDVMQKDLSLLGSPDWVVWSIIVAAVLCIGLLAGMYPAFYLSAFRPIYVLKNLPITTRTGFNFRHLLVVFQFGLATLLIVGLIVVHRQMDFLQSKNLGFEEENIVVVQNFPNSDSNFVMRNTLQELPGVLNIGASGQAVGLMDQSWMVSMNVKGSENKQPVMWGAYIDQNYLDVMEIELLEGRNFSPERDSSPRGLGNTVILNETAIKLLNVPEPVIGQKIVSDYVGEYTIVGVVKDFNATSLHDRILPFAFVFASFIERNVILKISGENVAGTISQIKEVWDDFVPNVPIDLYFLDSALEQQYKSEQNFKTIFSVMTFLCVLIACLGIFGLAAFTVKQRSKEISIRKVLGASVANLLLLLAREYARLIFIANIVAWPVAYLILQRWLESYAYKIDVGLGAFIISGILALALALFTVSSQLFKAARINPIKSLGAE